MKKIYLAALTLAMTACVSNEDLNPVDNYGYIDVNVSNDPVMVTRAEGDPSWIITATKDGAEYTEHSFVSGDNHVPAGTYVITAKSHDDEATANTTNSWGEAFYEGMSNSVEITAGQTETATISCGKAKNSRIKVNFSLQGDQFKDYKITLTQEPKSLTINSSNCDNFAYFSAQNVSFVFSYKFGNDPVEKTINSSITCEEGTEHQINIKSDDNGTITLSITYDKNFNDGNDMTLTFDAATGIQKQ